MAFDQLLSILQHTANRGSRSTALQPLGWLIALLIVLFVCCLKYSAPHWALLGIFCFAGSAVTVYLGVYIFLVGTNIDATRSERFVIEKMQIQQSRTGDDLIGFVSESKWVAERNTPLLVSDIDAAVDEKLKGEDNEAGGVQ